jgi:hypothetical protein
MALFGALTLLAEAAPRPARGAALASGSAAGPGHDPAPIFCAGTVLDGPLSAPAYLTE